MTSQPTQQATAESVEKVPVGTINVVDPHPLNWLYITWNTMERSRSAPTSGGTWSGR